MELDIFRYILLAFLILCAVYTCIGKGLLRSIIVYMSYSLIMSIVYLLLESPDLSITEAAVGAGVTTILFFVTLKKIHVIDAEEKIEDENPDAQIDMTGKQEKLPDVNPKHRRLVGKIFTASGILICSAIITVLIYTVSFLPRFGDPNNPVNDEVSERYIESGLEETGAVNIVTGMILDYRAFDTFGESCVLFIAVCAVMIMLRSDKQDDKEKENNNDRFYEPKNDLILQKAAKILVPVLFMFGIYVILNGHLSPGGGFSGGALIGAGLILYTSAFGFSKTERFFTMKTFRIVTCSALTFYCVAKSYSFYTGANHIESIIPLGTPGAILSSGLILPLNICVGLVVACTMYAFYSLFRKGGF